MPNVYEQEHTISSASKKYAQLPARKFINQLMALAFDTADPDTPNAKS